MQEESTTPDLGDEDLYSETPMQREVSEETFARLASEVKCFKMAIEEEYEFFSLPYHYVLSKKWLKRWKQFVSFEQRDDSNRPISKFFGCGKMPTVNEDLLDKKAKFTFTYPKEYEHLNYKLDLTKKEGIDFIYVSQRVWNVFDAYEQIPLKRHVVKGPDGPVVELHYQRVNVLPLSPSALKDIEHERVTKLLEFNFQVSKHMTLSEVNDLCKEGWAKGIQNTLGKPTYYSYTQPVYWEHQKPLKIWKLVQDTQKTIFMNTLRLGCKSNPSFGYKLYIPGSLIPPLTKFDECDLTDTTFLVAEMQEKNDAWCFFSKNHPLQGSCSYCKVVKTLTFLCSCKYAAYCSPRCKSDDKTHHKFRCPNEAESSDDQIDKKKETPNSMQGLTGLRNLGNTCFMNSALQCLSHIPQLTQYFLSGKYLHQINKENRLGTKGELSTNYARLIKAMWWGEQATFSPALLKKAIGIYQPMFSGYNQHDSGELITYLLDGLHEDLNRIKEKPYVQVPDANGRDDKIVAEEVWNGFLKRNRSIIVDLMYGQYKSVLDCPKCTYRSVQFDPFLICSLPIKNNNAKKIQITFVRDHIYSKKVTVFFQVEWQWTMKDVETELKKTIGIPEGGKEIIFYVASYTSCTIISKTKDVRVIRKEYEYQTIYARELIHQQSIEHDIRILLSSTAHHTHYAQDQTYRRSLIQFRLYFLKKTLTNKQVHQLLFQYYKPYSDINNYEEEVINTDKKDQPIRILTQPTSHYYSCQYCKNKSCYGCDLPYNDQPFTQRIEAAYSREKRIQMEIFWRINAKELEKKIQESKDVFSKLQHSQQNKVQKDQGPTVYDCLKLSGEAQILEENNEWYCPKCADFVLARKQMQIYRSPLILVLCLKRFKRKGQYYQEKFNILVDFPINELDMSPYVVDHSLPQSDRPSEVQVGPLMYDLIGVSNHFGSTGGGHYTAFCKDPNTKLWYDFDDSSVRKLSSEREVVSESAYILFYRRRTSNMS